MKPSNINITITPSSCPSTMDTFHLRPGGDGESSPGRIPPSVHSTKSHRNHVQEALVDSPSSHSSLEDTYDYASRKESGRHVQGLSPSVLATVEAVMGQLHDVDIHGNEDAVSRGEDADSEHSEAPRPVQQQRQRRIQYADYSPPQPPPPPVESFMNQKSRQQFKLKDNSQKPDFSPKNNKKNRVAPDAPTSKQEATGNPGAKDELANDGNSMESQGSRGANGGHFYTYENPPLVPESYQREFYERQLNPRGGDAGHQHQHLQQPLGEDAQLEMYRTKSFMSELSFDHQDPKGGPGGLNNFNQTFFRADPELEMIIVRKLDRNLLPLLGILYLFSYLDRVNIGNARLFGLEEAVHLTDGQYNIALASFFLAYCVFEIPSNWILVRLGPQTWIPVLMLAWGSISLALAWVTSFTGLIIARFALGVAEAGFVPGVLFYLTLFYKRSEHSFRMAIFLCFNILAGAFGGLLAAGISHLNGVLHLQGWQWIFILEAVPTILLAVVTWFVMTPSPSTAYFLTGEERIYAANRILMDSNVSPSKSASWKQTREAVTDYRIYLVCLATMFVHVPYSGVVLFLPSLVADMGFKATTAQLLTVPPYLIAACVSLIIPWWSDRRQTRGLFIIFVPFVAVLGFLLLAFAPWVWLRYLAVILVLCGMVPTLSILTSWLTNNCVGHTKRATALAMLVSSGGLASMTGTQVYRSTDAPRYQRGHLVMATCLALLILTAVALRTLLARENKRRDDSLTKGLTLIQFMSEGYLNNLGEKHPNYRYTL